NPVNIGIVVEVGDDMADFGLGGIGGHTVFDAFNADLLARLDLAADIDLTGGVFTDQNHGEAGMRALGLQIRDIAGDGLPQLGGDGFAVDQGHAVRNTV